jgi:hypothetical protein
LLPPFTITTLRRTIMKFLLVAASLVALLAQDLYAQGAKLQVIHNAADPAAAKVDIYVGQQKTIDDFAFRTASKFLDVPAGVPLVIGVAPGNSMNAGESIATFTVTLDANGVYLAIANGVLDAKSFTANPGSAPIGFNVFPIGKARTKGDGASTVDIKVFHGATDVGAVDIYAGDNKLLSKVGYGVSSDYLTVPAASYVIGVAPTGAQPIARFTADVAKLGGQAITVLASGFLNPAANKNGAAFGLFAVTADGGAFLPLPAAPAVEKARVQIVHNAADPAAAKVDVYVDGALTVNDFAFRSATPVLELEPGKSYAIGVAPGTSTSAADTLKNFNVALPAGNYVVFANGVIQQGFAANPSGSAIGFTIFPIANVRTKASSDNNIDFVVFHGVTDAPAVDVRVAGNNIVSALAYGKTSEYVSVPAADYVVDVAPAGGAKLVSYNVPGTALKGQSTIVFASGFLNPAANLNGPAFGLFALVGTNVVPLTQAVTSVREIPELSDVSVTPNPTTADVTARFVMPADGRVNVRAFDVAGTIVAESTIPFLANGMQSIPMAMNAAAAGGYIMVIDAGTHRSVVPFTIVR